MNKKNEITSQEIKNLVLERLKSFPAGKKLLVGGSKHLGKDEMIQQVKKETKVGQQIMDIQLNFIRSFKKNLS